MTTKFLWIDTVTETYGDAVNLFLVAQEVLNTYYSQYWSALIANGDARPTDEIVLEVFGEEPDDEIKKVADRIGCPLGAWTPFAPEVFGQPRVFIDRQTSTWGDASDVVIVGVDITDEMSDDDITDACEAVFAAVCDPDEDIDGVAVAPF